MKKNNFKIIIGFFIIGIIVLTVGLFTDQTSDFALLKNSQFASVIQLNSAPTANLAATSTGYQPISGIDFEAAKDGQESNFIGLLRTIFNWGIAIAVILATLMVVFGAIQYMTTDAIFDKKEGRQRITSAIGGLILALVSWLILASINESILTSNFLLKLNDLSENNASQEPTTATTTPAGNQKNSYAEYIENQKQADLAAEQAEFLKKERESWIKIKNECFDNDGNYIEPPQNEMCNSVLIKTAGVSGIDKSIEIASEKETELWIKSKELMERNNNLSGSSESESKINEIEENITEIQNDVSNLNTNQNNTYNNNRNTGSNTTTDKLTIQDLIDANNKNNPEYNPDLYEPRENLSDDDLNVLAFQDQAFKNIFVKNQSADILNMSESLENMLLIFRDTCCGGKTIIEGNETYKSSFNVSDIYKDDNSFLIEKSFTNGYGANSWSSLNDLVIKNTYPDQNMIDITKYLDCVDSRMRFTTWTCRKPNDFRDITGRYYNLNKKGVIENDLLKGKAYLGEIKGLNVEVIYNNNSWKIKTL